MHYKGIHRVGATRPARLSLAPLFESAWNGASVGATSLKPVEGFTSNAVTTGMRARPDIRADGRPFLIECTLARGKQMIVRQATSCAAQRGAA